MSLHRFTIVLFALVVSAPCQNVLLLQDGRDKSAQIDRIQTAATQLGLQVALTDSDALGTTMQSIQTKQMQIQGILISADTLASLENEVQDRVLRLSRQNHLPVLLFDITAETDPVILRKWSHQQLSVCRNEIDKSGSATTILMSQEKRNGPLAGVEIPSAMKPACTFVRDGTGEVEHIVTTGGSHQVPVLARVDTVFFAPRLERMDASSVATSSSISEVFSSVAAFVVFLRDIAGEYAWHLDGHYANFTIDDPWLIQPYGNLDYVTLLAAMKEHGFHTTIAFVPWNYDRSKPEVSELFRKNSQYYSVSIHGNNHIHREFGDYSYNSLAQQTSDIKQAIVRMDAFHQLTGISYDRLMVFPHGVAPEATFKQLNRYGFLGTANSLNVPLDDQSKEGPLDNLRPFTNKYQGLLSIFRYSAEVPISDKDLAVQAYLGNPILVYAHQEAFRDGNKFIVDVVDRINRMVPDVRWVSLGDLARHLYLLRKRADNAGFDVALLSKEATITNTTAAPSKFYIRLLDPTSDLADVRIDGRSVSTSGDSGILQVDIAAGQSHTIAMKRAGESELASTVVEKGGVRAIALRSISDFRDLYLSRAGLGRAVIQWYYSSRSDTVELFIEQKWKYILGFFSLIACALVLKFRRVQIAD